MSVVLLHTFGNFRFAPTVGTITCVAAWKALQTVFVVSSSLIGGSLSLGSDTFGCCVNLGIRQCLQDRFRGTHLSHGGATG